MYLTEDQAWALDHIVQLVGYNGGFDVKRPLFKRRGPITVRYRDQNHVLRECKISSDGGRFDEKFAGLTERF